VLSGTPGPNVQGKIRAIDAANRTVTLGKSTIPVARGAVLTAEGVPVAFEDLTIGQSVSVYGVKAAAYPVRFRAYDSTYSPYEHVAAWFVPFGVTAVCLLGFWNMRRRMVFAYGVLVLGQVVLPGVIDGYPLPTSVTAVTLQVLVFGVGAVNLGRMH
jgi:hypothetical protein